MASVKIEIVHTPNGHCSIACPFSRHGVGGYPECSIDLECTPGTMDCNPWECKPGPQCPGPGIYELHEAAEGGE